MAGMPVIHIRVFSTISRTLSAFAWALSNHARTSPWTHLPASSVTNPIKDTVYYSHAQTLKNECADRAAALGTFGLVSNHNVRTRQTHPSFDSNSFFAPCDNLGDVLQVLHDVRTARVSASQRLVRSCDLFHTVSLCGLSRFRPCFLVGSLICCLAQPMQTPLCGGKPCLTMEAPCASSTSTCSSLLTPLDFDGYDEHNMWNPLLNLLCREYVGTVMESYLDEAVLGRITLSCHFALDLLLCDKAEFHLSPKLRLAFAAPLPLWRTR